MVTYILMVELSKTKYFVRFVAVAFPVFRTLPTLKYGQTTLLNSRAFTRGAL
jgi:hypothetical protein